VLLGEGLGLAVGEGLGVGPEGVGLGPGVGDLPADPLQEIHSTADVVKAIKRKI
jgi:hypothetical protein